MKTHHPATRGATGARRLLGSCTVSVLVLTGLTACDGSAADDPVATPSVSGQRLERSFDLEAHRGGAGLVTENTIRAYDNALSLGVSTLELDTQVTSDGIVIVSHDTRIVADKCRDTKPVRALDPSYPYVGKKIHDLDFAQVQTLDCGYRQAKQFPDQVVATGARMPRLSDVFDLLERRKATDVELNVEIKVKADAPEETAPREEFVRKVWDVVADSGMADRVRIQSFDWASLELMHGIAPSVRLVALTQPRDLQVGKAGASPWLGGLDVDAFDGDVVAAADSIDGVVAISPVHTFPVDAGMVSEAHAAGLEVIPWTVDKPKDMRRLIGLGVDGIITNRPDLLRTVLTESGIATPASHPAAG